MSLQINLSSLALKESYDAVLNGPSGSWTIWTYEKGTNDLKVQGNGSDGLDELEEEFSDGRIQYAFVKVLDPNVCISISYHAALLTVLDRVN